MRHLTPADYTRQTWKNGRGVTTELLRLTDPDGSLTLRLSMATVSEDGPFSTFPGVERNLTVLSGPGFRLMGDGIDLACAPLCPVAFPGDVTLTALDTGGNPSRDFNVMTARHLPRPEVTVLAAGVQTGPGWQALYPLAMGDANGSTLSPGDLYLTDKTIAFRGAGKAILVRLFGLDEALSALRS